MRFLTWLILGCLGVVSFARPTEAQLLQKLKQGIGKVLENQSQPDNPAPLAPRTDDAFAPGFLGLTADEPRAGDRGVRVLSVREGSPAEAVGLRTGDIVVAIDGVPMRSLDDMDAMLSRVTVGQTLRIVAERGGEQRTVMPKLVARNTVFKQPAPEVQFEDGPRVDRPAGRGALGMTVAPLTDEARRQFGLTPTRGAIVTNVVPGSPAEAARIPVGAAIVAVDGRRVDTADELMDLMRLVRPDQEVELTYYQGAQLGRKVLRATAAAGDAPRANPPLFGDPGAAPGDRPILRTLEKVLEGAGQGGVIPPAIRPQPQPQPLPVAPGDVVRETETLRRDIDQLRRQLQQLEGRLSELELRNRP